MRFMANVNLLEIKGTGNLIPQMLNIVKEGNLEKAVVDQIATLVTNKSAVFYGFTVSDYALASLFWIGTPYSTMMFNRAFNGLHKGDKKKVQALIDQKAYRVM